MMGLKRLHQFLNCLIVLGITASVAAATESDVTAPAGELIGSARGHFGASVAISGSFAAVGHPGAHWRRWGWGSVYIYEWIEGTWFESAELQPQWQRGIHRFGIDVAIDGDTVAVGASGNGSAYGIIYIFERFGDEWHQVARLTEPRGQHSQFGQSVALSGHYLLVGLPGDEEAGTESGAVYVYRRQQGVWQETPVQTLTASDAVMWSSFGADVAMMGPYAVVGAPRDDDRDRGNRDYGAAYVFELEDGVWRETAKLQAEDRASHDHFGHAVSLIDDEILIGAPGHRGAGAAYMFARDQGVWAVTQKLMPSLGEPGDRFGEVVAFNHRFALIGADESAIVQDSHDHQPHDRGHHGPHHNRHHHHLGRIHWQGDHSHDHQVHRRHGRHHHSDDHDHMGSIHEAGAVYVFERQGADWHEVDILTPSRGRRHAHFGLALALDGNHALIGAPTLARGRMGRLYAYHGFQSNNAPNIFSTPLEIARVGTLYQYAVEASDVDHDPLVYALNSAPSDMQIDAFSGLIEWLPQAPGDVEVELEVRDEQGGVATQSYIITVHPNRSPIITSTPLTQVELFHLIPEVHVTDPTLVSQTITLNGEPYTPGVAITSAGVYELTIEATDAAGNINATTIQFTLEATPLSSIQRRTED